jgi:GT2 family glycosyltransferase
VGYIDADTRVPAGWFQRIQNTFADNEELVCLSGPYDYYDLGSFKRFAVYIWWTVLAMPLYWIAGYMVVGGNFVARRDALNEIGGFDTNIAFYGEDTNIARRLHAVGKVKFSQRFRIGTSARRLQNEGLFKIAFVYAANFFSEVILHKPVTKEYIDIR